MHYVYILKSLKDPAKVYDGQTNDPNRRLHQHNQSPSCTYPRFYKP